MSVLTEQHIADVMQQYVDAITEGDLEKILDLFADDAVVEDPVGSEPKRGKDALREFYQMTVDSVEKMVLDGNARAREKWGACAMRAYPKGMEGKMQVETLDVMEFNQQGKVVSMTAYFGDNNIRMES
ncbi:MAG: SgcJ/EcaC family oxidoreductase [Gammaproteobacteria bacterium]|nr:SgcJ/EcaC family oxidoreductase [Gammaproteobacteria bacterium]